MSDKPQKQEKFDLLSDANLLIDKYKIKYSFGQYWFLDNQKWVSSINKPLTLIITREFGDKYRSSFAKIEQVEKFIRNVVQDKFNIDIKKTLSVYFLNGVVKYNSKSATADDVSLPLIEQASFHEYKSDEERATFTPAIINDNFIGCIGSDALNKAMSTPEGQEIIRVVDKYFNFLAYDQNNNIRKEVKDYLLALGWIAHSTGTIEQITYLVSAGGSGKSWFTNKVLYNLIGKQNFTSFKIDKLNDTFGWAPLVNKTLAVDGECSTKLLEEDTFKQLCGTDIINVNLKNKDPVNTELVCTPILCTNHLPKYTDATNSMSRRLVLIKLFSCVYEDISAAKKVKSKLALTDAEEKVFFSPLSLQYIRSLMFDAFCRIYDPETKLITPPEDSSDLNRSLEIENNELYSWIEEEDWITQELEASSIHELFVYPSYIFEKYKEYYKTQNNDSDKGFQWKKAGLWQKFKELLESKYSNKFVFDVNAKERRRVKGTNSQPTGFVIKQKGLDDNLSEDEISAAINSYNTKIREYLTKAENLKDEISKLHDLQAVLEARKSQSKTILPPQTSRKEEK